MIERHLLSSSLRIAKFLSNASRCKAEDRDAMKHVESHIVNNDNGRVHQLPLSHRHAKAQVQLPWRPTSPLRTHCVHLKRFLFFTSHYCQPPSCCLTLRSSPGFFLRDIHPTWGLSINVAKSQRFLAKILRPKLATSQLTYPSIALLGLHPGDQDTALRWNCESNSCREASLDVLW